jgi:hypothetical protein
LIVPIGGALYRAGGSNEQLAADRDTLVCLRRGIKESLRVLDADRIPVIPSAARIYTWVPASLLILFIRKMLRSPEGRLALSHAGNARPEMRVLADQFSILIKQSRLPTPALDQLFGAI